MQKNAPKHDDDLKRILLYSLCNIPRIVLGRVALLNVSKVAEWWIKNLKPIFWRPLVGQELTVNEQNKLENIWVDSLLQNFKQQTNNNANMDKIPENLKVVHLSLSITKGLIS